MKFLGGCSMSRYDLLEGGTDMMKRLILQFLQFTRFDTPYGSLKINDLFKKHGIEATDDSLRAFLQQTVGERVGLIAFETGPDDYEFHLVTGTQEDLLRMSGDISREPRVSLEVNNGPTTHQSLSPQ